jgi:hypothetical protein
MPGAYIEDAALKGRGYIGLARHCGTGIRKDEGVHPRGDRKSSEAIENRGDSVLPLLKRVCNLMIMLDLQGCNKKERT